MLLGMCTSAPDSADSASATNCARALARRGCQAAARAVLPPGPGRLWTAGLAANCTASGQGGGERVEGVPQLIYVSCARAAGWDLGEERVRAQGRTLPSWYTLPPLSMSSLDTSGNSARTASCAGRPPPRRAAAATGAEVGSDRRRGVRSGAEPTRAENAQVRRPRRYMSQAAPPTRRRQVALCRVCGHGRALEQYRPPAACA